MKPIDCKIHGDDACPACGGVGKIPVVKIPFTDIFVWKECESCRNTGRKSMGFERNTTPHVISCANMRTYDYEWDWGYTSPIVYECGNCGSRK